MKMISWIQKTEFLFFFLKCTKMYQLGGATSGEDPAGTLQVEMTRAPAAHVEPLHGSGRTGSVFSVQQDELL